MRSRAEPSTILAVRFPLSEREAVRLAAAAAGESFGGYVRRAAMRRLQAEAAAKDADAPSECLAA